MSKYNTQIRNHSHLPKDITDPMYTLVTVVVFLFKKGPQLLLTMQAQLTSIQKLK